MEEAVSRGDLELVKEFIQIGSDGSDWRNDASLLVSAIEEGHEDVALVLLSARSLSWEVDWAALDLAHDKGLEKIVQEIIYRSSCLVRAGVSCKGLSQEQMNRLFCHACHEGDMSVVRNLLKSGCCISILSREEQEKLLCHAFDKSRFQVRDIFVVEAILQKGDISILSREEQEWLLHRTCHNGNSSVVDALITNGCNVNCTKRKDGSYYSAPKCTPLMAAACEGHEEVVKKLILANTKIEMQDAAGYTALHHAAAENHIQCGVLLAEGGASVRTKDNSSHTPLDIARSAEFRDAIKHAISFTTRKTLCIIGNAESGKSTLIAAFQAENNSFLGKIFNRLRRVDDHRKRTAGIETIPHSSQKYGEVICFDFAGQHEYHGPHQMFLQSLFSKPGVSMTILLVVKATDEEETIFHQLHRWLSPVALLATTTSPPQVIVIGSFLDKVKSKEEAAAKLTKCFDATRKHLEELPLELVGNCLLNCRQPQSDGMDELCRYLEEIPIPEFRASHTQYSLAWVLSQIRSRLKAHAVQVQEFSKWIHVNKCNLPRIMPPPEEVCQDLTAAGYALYLPNDKDPPKGWLVLDLPSILHNVYGTLFSQFEEIVNEFGLIHIQHLANLIPNIDIELVQQLLISLEFCIPVDPSILKVEVKKLTQSNEAQGWLFFPALISTKRPQPIIANLPQQSVCYLRWQLRTSKKHSLSARVLQTILLRLAAHFVVKQHDEEGVQQHCCSIWWNGITWQSKTGVDVTVHITNRVIWVVGTSSTSDDISFRYLSDVISDVLSVVHCLSPNLTATAYIVHPPKLAVLHEDAPPPKWLFLVEDIRNSIEDDYDYALSCKDSTGHSTRLLVSDLFGEWSPSLEDIERILWVHPGRSQLEQSTTPYRMVSSNLPLLPIAATVDPLTSIGTVHTTIPPGAQALLDTSAVPTLNVLNELVVAQIAAKWPNLAIKLGVKDFLIDTISKNNPLDCEGACQDMLKRWLREERHTGGEERTWSTLLTALGRADFGELERSLRSEHFFNTK